MFGVINMNMTVQDLIKSNWNNAIWNYWLGLGAARKANASVYITPDSIKSICKARGKRRRGNA